MKRLKKIWSIVSTILVVIVVLLAALLVGARLFNVKPYCVISGSMRPEYPVGSLIYVKEVSPAAVKVGDVITYSLPNGTPSTHRVIRIDNDNQQFYTKGDANNTVDQPVAFNALIGTPVFKIPLVGFIAYCIQNPPGSYIAISAGAIFMLLTFLPDLLKNDPKKSLPDSSNDRDSTMG